MPFKISDAEETITIGKRKYFHGALIEEIAKLSPRPMGPHNTITKTMKIVFDNFLEAHSFRQSVVAIDTSHSKWSYRALTRKHGDDGSHAVYVGKVLD